MVIGFSSYISSDAKLALCSSFASGRFLEQLNDFTMRFATTVLTPLLVLASLVSSKIVQISDGSSVQGGTCKTTYVNYFFSIPYAEPPVEELRYAPPRPPCLASSHRVIGLYPVRH